MRPARQYRTGARGLCCPPWPSQRTAPVSELSGADSRSFWVTAICSHFTIFVPANCLEREIHPSPTFSVLLDFTKERRERVVRPGTQQEPSAGRKDGSWTKVGLKTGENLAFALGGRRPRGRT